MDDTRFIKDYFADFHPGDGEVHVLVVVPEWKIQAPVESVRDLFAEFREDRIRQERFQRQMEESLAALRRKESRSLTDGALGETTRLRLETNGLIFEVASTENGEAFWSEQDQEQADGISIEADFNAFVTPLLNETLSSCGMVFVNSERCPWLPQAAGVEGVSTKTDLRPDGFATHAGMYRSRPGPDEDNVDRQADFRFGVPERDLFDCVILLKSALTYNDAALGQMVRYLGRICPKGPASAILFDRRSFWLIKSYDSVVFKVQTARWVDKGSKELFQGFVADNTPPWVARLTSACALLGVDAVEGESFLGRGAYGRVFKVTQQDQKLALKIVENCSIERLHQEREALARAHNTGLVISPVKLVETPNTAMLLLSPVGDPLPQPTTRQEVRNLFELLWELHAKGLVHGDPRVPNVIIDKGKLLWIDLVEVVEASPALKRTDAEILTRSILRTNWVDPELKQLIDKYGHSATQDNLTHLAEKVCRSFES